VLRLGIDVGGTFTDLLLHDTESDQLWLAKVPSEAGERLVSVEAAARDYGVALHGDAVDGRATGERRRAVAAERGEPPQFDFGELPEGLSVG
jgi:N-methylhydantoinase A/oxoprolinase/acetone carboxylase beta subunit